MSEYMHRIVPGTKIALINASYQCQKTDLQRKKKHLLEFNPTICSEYRWNQKKILFDSLSGEGQELENTGSPNSFIQHNKKCSFNAFTVIIIKPKASYILAVLVLSLTTPYPDPSSAFLCSAAHPRKLTSILWAPSITYSLLGLDNGRFQQEMDVAVCTPARLPPLLNRPTPMTPALSGFR